MNRKSRYLVMSYGFLLTWLLTFLYNGPLLNYAFDSLIVNMNYLVVMYIVMPSITCFLFSLIFKEEYNAYILVKYGLITCFVGTVILMFFNSYMNVIFIYLISGMLGISTIVYISGWGKLFVKHLSLLDMFKIMGLTICFGKGLFSLNQLLCKYNLDFLVIIIIFLSLGLAYYTSIKLKEYEYENNEEMKAVVFNSDMLIVLCFTMFFINIGRGFILSFVTTNFDTVISVFLIDLILYISVFLILIKTNKNYQGQIVMTSALMMLGIGFITLILIDRNVIIPYTAISLAYLILNIHIWSVVGRVGYMFNMPYKVFFVAMGSNLFAVFLGNILFVTIEDVNISILISSICILIAFLFCQILYEKLEKIQTVFDKQNENLLFMDTTNLTKKELEITLLMCENYKNVEIAEKVFISENTFKTHARNIYSKLGVRSKKELVEKNERNKKSKFHKSL